MQASRGRKDPNVKLRKEAAQRLLSLMQFGETLADFARRVDLPYNTLHNYENQGGGIDLGILSRARIEPDEVAYVLKGGEKPQVVVRPSDEALLELREWIDRVLPTSRASSERPGLSEDEMAALLRARSWMVSPPPDRKQGGGGHGGA